MEGHPLLLASDEWEWDVVRMPDGTVVMTRSRRWHYVRGRIGAGLAFAWSCIVGFILYASRSRRGRPVRLDPITMSGFLGIPLVCWCLDLYAFFFREEWQAGPGLMVMRKQFFGFRQTREFADGELLIRRDSFNRHPQWRLLVKARRAACTFAFVPLSQGDWRLTEMGTLAQVLAEATGFPLEDEEGVMHRIGYRSPSAGTGPALPVRRLGTGQVLAQIPGSTLAGASLPGIRLPEANLQGADLRGANFEGADLRGSSLENANLANAKLRGVHLTAADLSGADLTGADLTGATYDVRMRWPAGFDAARNGAVQS